MSLFAELDGIRQQALNDLTATIDTLHPAVDPVQSAMHNECNTVLTRVIVETMRTVLERT